MGSYYFITGTIHIQTSKKLEEVGDIISNKLFNGLKFGGKDKYRCEEIPAIYISNPIMGMEIILNGYGGDDGYNLNIFPSPKYSLTGKEIIKVDISEHLANLIGEDDALKVDLG